jgi:hypothetical protein
MLRAVMAPLRGSAGWARLLLAASAVALCCAMTIKLAYLPYAFAIPDGPNYTAIAHGDSAHVMQPFVSRQLGAVVAGAAAHLLHWTVEQAFFLQAVLALVFTLAILFAIVMKTLAPRWMLLAIAVAPFWSPQVQYFTLPDAWYTALLAVLLVLLLLDRLGTAALMMFPLMLSRESTSLTLVCFLIAGWKQMRWRDRLAAVGAAGAGSWVVGRLTAGSQANQEHIPQAVYLLMKAPWNFLRNVVGVQPWSNVNTELCAVPRYRLPLHVGSMTAIGMCGFSAVGLKTWVVAIFLNFGLLPVLVAVLWWRHRRRAERTVLLKFALLYGGVSFVLAPMLGTWMIHLLGYGWPLFFVALPLLMDEFPGLPLEGKQAWAGFGFLVLHLGACLLAPQFDAQWYLPVQVLLWGIGWELVRVWLSGMRIDRAADALQA